MSRSRRDCERLDETGSPLDAIRDRFAAGPPGTLYFDANSIGPMPADVPTRIQRLLDAGWRIARRRGWNELDWLEQPRRLGDAFGGILGTAPGDVVVCDTTSVNQYKLLRHALSVAAPRRTIVLQHDVFPSNRYVAEGIADAGLARLRTIDGIDGLEAALTAGDVAVVALSHVDYRSGERLDIREVTALAHRHRAVALWDLSHSAGAVGIALRDADVDYAVGCGYKYLCGGPGAPSLLYVHPRWHASAWPAIRGWMGHVDTFAFEPGYRPADGIERHLVGTPAVIANAAFAAAAELWRGIDAATLDTRHRSLTDLLIELVDRECAGLGIQVASPREHRRRGGHVALRFADAPALAAALVADGVVVSARKPDSLRFGVHPLVTRHADVWDAVQRMRQLLVAGRWREHVDTRAV